MPKIGVKYAVIGTAEIAELREQINHLFNIVSAQHQIIIMERSKVEELELCIQGDALVERVTHDTEEDLPL